MVYRGIDLAIGHARLGSLHIGRNAEIAVRRAFTKPLEFLLTGNFHQGVHGEGEILQGIFAERRRKLLVVTVRNGTRDDIFTHEADFSLVASSFSDAGDRSIGSKRPAHVVHLRDRTSTRNKRIDQHEQRRLALERKHEIGG